MKRNEQTLIGNSAYGGMGNNPNMLNLAEGGFFGWSPDLANTLSEQGYVRKPLEIVVIESPRFFNLMPNPAQWHASFRNLMERKAIRVDGYNAGLTVEADDHAAGGAGEMMQEPTNVVRARTEPSFFVHRVVRSSYPAFPRHLDPLRYHGPRQQVCYADYFGC